MKCHYCGSDNLETLSLPDPDNKCVWRCIDCTHQFYDSTETINEN